MMFRYPVNAVKYSKHLQNVIEVSFFGVSLRRDKFINGRSNANKDTCFYNTLTCLVYMLRYFPEFPDIKQINIYWL